MRPIYLIEQSFGLSYPMARSMFSRLCRGTKRYSEDSPMIAVGKSSRVSRLKHRSQK